MVGKMKYQVYDTVNKCFMNVEYSTHKRAQAKADKLDLIYGAIRYMVKKGEKNECV